MLKAEAGNVSSNSMTPEETSFYNRNKKLRMLSALAFIFVYFAGCL